jgi:hypothetical protein
MISSRGLGLSPHCDHELEVRWRPAAQEHVGHRRSLS